MREPNRRAFDSVKPGLIHLVVKVEGPNKGPNPTVRQLAARLIKRGDSMTKAEWFQAR
jgi:hypothetical protein